MKNEVVMLSEAILDVTSVTKRFQTTIPKLVREHLKVTTDDRLLWLLDPETGEVIVRKA